MKVTMKIKVYTLLMMSAVMVGNTATTELDSYGNVYEKNNVILLDQSDDEDEGWYAEEFDLMMEKI